MVILEKIADALGIFVERLTGEAASSIIEDRLEAKGMTLKEVAEKANVSLNWLENLDDFTPGEDDLVESHGLDWDSPISVFSYNLLNGWQTGGKGFLAQKKPGTDPRLLFY